MFVIRDVFNAKPGKAKNLVELFGEAMEYMQGEGILARRILVDAVADYWTVVLETEVEDLSAYFSRVENPAGREKMAGYLEFVDGGRREIFKVAWDGASQG